MSTKAEAHTSSNWGRWGEDDQLGAGNLLTAEVVLSATGLVSAGRVLSLAMPIRSSRLPIFGGRPPIIHTMRWDGGDFLAGARAPDDTKSADDYLFVPLHGTTHIDSLAHAWYGDHLYNGVPQNLVRSSGARRLGAERLPPIVARGVLIDCVRFMAQPPEPGEQISRAEIEGVLEAEGVKLQRGDVALIRTGWLEAWRSSETPQELIEREQGLGVDTVELWAGNDVVAVGADNCSVEVWPNPDGRNIPFHRRMIRDYGIYLMELLDLEELARSGRFEFMFVAAPLPVVGGTGSPLSPLAIL